MGQGNYMFELAQRLFPITRSITGEGVRETLNILQNYLTCLKMYEISSGTKIFDWQVPDEWNIHDAFVMDNKGDKIIDFKKNNLHVVSYSPSVDRYVSKEELDEHLYSIPELPNAIPYVTAYYRPEWGFCLPHNLRITLEEGQYRVYVDSTLKPGSLTYGELIIPGQEKSQILLSTYLCHPSLANDNLSGIVVTTYLALWLLSLPRLRYTYRIIFIPETIGSLAYLRQHIDALKQTLIAGFVITCVGDNLSYSFLPSRSGSTYADRVASTILMQHAPNFKRYSFLDRGSDERQYCSPGVDLPVVSLMRTKYGEYPEYHTSLDNLSFISPDGLQGAYELYQKVIVALEKNAYYRSRVIGEPQLGKRGLYPLKHKPGSVETIRTLRNVLAYCDGKRDLVDIAATVNAPFEKCVEIVNQLVKHELIEMVDHNVAIQELKQC